MKLVSVVIPAYKAERVIVKTLQRVRATLDNIRYPSEIICVVDGGGDKTFEKAKNFSASNTKKIRVYGYSENFGKGYAVRYGMGKANGDVIGFIDAGVELNPNAISMLLEHLEWYNADIIVGSKRHPASKVYYPWQRKILSFGYQIIVKILFGLNLRDTQGGIKFFRSQVIKRMLPKLQVNSFAFDIEMLSVANALGFKKIYEAPIESKMNFKASTIASKGFVKTSWYTLVDTLRVFFRLKILRSYNK